MSVISYREIVGAGLARDSRLAARNFWSKPARTAVVANCVHEV
ncbi:hypothetical protein [Chroococcidiopsis sp. SAG 2025]|nr:hypothetical protein [Chroococcidiopsis sp. SAG 2025]